LSERLNLHHQTSVLYWYSEELLNFVLVLIRINVKQSAMERQQLFKRKQY